MPTETPNYKLIKPDEDEFYDINIHNQNSDIIDAALNNTPEKNHTHTKSQITDFPTSLPPSGAAGGDLQGNYPNPTINPTSLEGKAQTFTQATTRANIASGETFKVILGKLMKWFTDLKTVAWSGNYNDLTNTPTSLPANGGTSAACSGNAATATYAVTAGNADTVDGFHLQNTDNGLTPAYILGGNGGSNPTMVMVPPSRLNVNSASYAHYAGAGAQGNYGAFLLRNAYLATWAPNSGSSGDLWFQYT